MELLNVVDDFFVTASLALLLTFIVLKLVDAVNDTHSTPKRHVPRQPVRPVSHAKPLTVQPAENKSKVSVISPVQASTCVKTESKIEDDTIQPVHSVPVAQLNLVQPAACDEIEHQIKEPVCPVPTVQLAQNENTVAFINPVQAATCAETESKIEDATVQPVPSFVQLSPVQGATYEETECKIEEATVEPVLPVQPVQCDSTVDLISPVQTATCIETEHKIEEGTVESDSAEKKNVESVEEISVEPSSEIEVSVVDSSVKENDDHNHDHVDDDDDDDWEGIERSELEKEFMAATEFANGEDNRLGIVGSNVQMELYGLHKIATEGPCREPQPIPLKISARAKWYQFSTYVTPFRFVFFFFFFVLSINAACYVVFITC